MKKCDKCHGTGEVPDPVPEWIERAVDMDIPAVKQRVAEAWLRQVEERAKAAAERMSAFGGAWGPEAYRVFREEMLR